MIVASYIYIGQFAPVDVNQLWAKPEFGGRVSLHVFSDGGWKAVGEGDGKSAYELAVERGYSGTLDEWLESLKGESLTYDKLTSGQKAELAQDAVAAANRAAQAAETIEAAISNLDPSQSAEDAVVELAARQGVLEGDIAALGPKLEQVEDKVDALAVGKFYGYKASSSALPSSGDEDGYAYVGTAAPYAIYNATSNNGTLTWTDSGTTISNLAVADEEDIDYDANGKLQLANRAVATNQKGYKILRKDASLASQMTDVNTIYEVRYAFDLNGGTLTIPSGCTLKFNGGSIANGIINGTTFIESANTGIFSNITGTIVSLNKLEATWFSDSLSMLNPIMSIFSNSCICLNGTFLHDATLVIPYDIQVECSYGKIVAENNIPVFEVYIQNKDLLLSNMQIIISDTYEGNVCVLHGKGNTAIKGYDSVLLDSKIRVELPKVYGNSQAGASEYSSTAYKLTCDSESYYEYLYYAHIVGYAKNVNTAMRVDFSSGRFNSNDIELSCWWCTTGISSNLHFADSNDIRLLYQCNSYSQKAVHCDSTNIADGGATYHIAIWDENHAPNRQLIDNTLKGKYINIGESKYITYVTLQAFFVNNLTNTNNALEVTPQGNVTSNIIDDWKIIYNIIQYGGYGSDNCDTIIQNFVSYTNLAFLRNTKYTFIASSAMFPNAALVATVFNNIKKGSHGEVFFENSNVVFVEIDCTLPLYKKTDNNRLVNKAVIKLVDAATHRYISILYDVSYNNNSLDGVSRTNLSGDAIVVSSFLDLKKYVGLNDGTIVRFVDGLVGVKNGKYIVDNNGGYITRVSSIGEAQNAVANSHTTFFIDGKLYRIKSLGSCPAFRFVFSAFPTEPTTLVITYRGVDYSISISGSSSWEDFFPKMCDAIDTASQLPLIVGSDRYSVSSKYLYIDICTFIGLAASTLNGITVKNENDEVIATSQATKYGKASVICNMSSMSGTTTERPVGVHEENGVSVGDLNGADIGFEYFDSTLGKPIFVKSVNSTTGVVVWVDATGSSV